jgi:hypothetical protein
MELVSNGAIAIFDNLAVFDMESQVARITFKVKGCCVIFGGPAFGDNHSRKVSVAIRFLNATAISHPGLEFAGLQ